MVSDIPNSALEILRIITNLLRVSQNCTDDFKNICESVWLTIRCIINESIHMHTHTHSLSLFYDFKKCYPDSLSS